MNAKIGSVYRGRDIGTNVEDMYNLHINADINTMEAYQCNGSPVVGSGVDHLV